MNTSKIFYNSWLAVPHSNTRLLKASNLACLFDCGAQIICWLFRQYYGSISQIWFKLREVITSVVFRFSVGHKRSKV